MTVMREALPATYEHAASSERSVQQNRVKFLKNAQISRKTGRSSRKRLAVRKLSLPGRIGYLQKIRLEVASSKAGGKNVTAKSGDGVVRGCHRVPLEIAVVQHRKHDSSVCIGADHGRWGVGNVDLAGELYDAASLCVMVLFVSVERR
jgi:hypothetical protein